MCYVCDYADRIVPILEEASAEMPEEHMVMLFAKLILGRSSEPGPILLFLAEINGEIFESLSDIETIH